jgi:rhodanese-related sulfurtransferase
VKKMKILLPIAALAVVAGLMLARQSDGGKLVTPAQVASMLKADTTIVLLDVRTPAEFNGETGHLAGAILIPVQELEQRVDEMASYKGRQVVVYCRTGHRSTAGSAIMLKHGFNAVNMEGGITRWRAEGLPTVK